VYRNDKKYGAMICASPPFNLLILPFVPYFWISRDEGNLKSLNSMLCKIIYFPLILVLSIVFIVANVILIPFAYIKTLIHKISLFARKQSSCQTMVFYFFFGIPMLLVAQVTDFYWFVKHAYMWEKQEVTEEG